MLAPLELLGWLLHVLVFGRGWTVAVTPWHNLPGPRYRERTGSRATAEARSEGLRRAIEVGLWKPGDELPAVG